MAEINEAEMDAAIEKVATTTNAGRASKSLAMKLASRVKEIREDGKRRYAFAQALRFGLNETGIRYPERPLYRAVIGSYFGSHGGRVAARNKAAHKPTQSKTTTKGDSPPDVKIEKTGQMTFRM